MAVIGLDAGGTKILVGVVDDEGRILCSQKYPMKRGVQEEAIGTIFGALDDFIQNIRGADLPPVTGIGMGTTGHIDFDSGVIVSCIGTGPGASGAEIRLAGTHRQRRTLRRNRRIRLWRRKELQKPSICKCRDRTGFQPCGKRTSPARRGERHG